MESRQRTVELKELVGVLQITIDPWLTPQAQMPISGIAYDSRRVSPGDLFVAISGHRDDGHKHLSQALDRGAVAIVGERPQTVFPASVPYLTVKNARQALAELACAFYDFPTGKLFTVGVTGTKGKTSVAHLAASVLGQEKTELVSTVTNASQRGLNCTTPEALELQQISAAALERSAKNLVLEVSAHALSLERVRGCQFRTAVFTNLSQDHFDYYPDFDAYLDAKLELFRMLGPEATAIVNADDPFEKNVRCATRAQILSFGLSEQADIWAEAIRLGPDGAGFIAHTPKGELPLLSHFPGQISVYNALAAIGVGVARGLALNTIKQGIEAVRQIEGRFERFRAPTGQAVIIDFAHSPASLEQAILALKPFYARLVTIFGCGGDSDPYKRPLMGAISGRLSDYTIITSDNPKHEDPEAIIAQIAVGLDGLNRPYEVIPDRKAAILRAFALTNPGDALLIAGKGHEQTQIFAEHEVPYNDRLFLIERGLIKV
jgi:UDP-N-acetylmuramoyl-L-alanyl-D-glutamate--2,6-diaminopimelate ligase